MEGGNPPKFNSTWLIFIPSVFICLLPFFTAISYVIRLFIRSGGIKITPEMYREDEQLKYLSEKAAHWVLISLLTWITVFLLIASISISLMVKEHIQKGSKLITNGQPINLSPGSESYTLLSILDFLIQYLFPIPLLALLLGVITVIILLVRKRPNNQMKSPKKIRVLAITSIAAFVLPTLLIFILSFPFISIVRRELKSYLRELSPKASVIVNGEQVKNPHLIIEELKKLKSFWAHHSHPEHYFRLEISDVNDGLTLYTARDSNRPNEYWIFYPGFDYSYSNEIGRITTSVFDDY
jgi:hypothetical protein